ncbi:MAG: IucA/IucC family siderophore biosynthesis protein [Solirubrobacteraceae bacterium]
MSIATVPARAADPLLDPDPRVIADHAAVEPLLRAWVRETGVRLPASGATLRLDLPRQAQALWIPVRHRSPTGWHRFGRVRSAPESGATPVAHADVATLVLTEAALLRGRPASAAADAIARAVDSAARVAEHLADRRRHPEDPSGTLSYRAGEESLTVGHPFHPTGKSRDEPDPARRHALSPELRGRLRLHWLGIAPGDLVGAGPGEESIATTLRKLAATDDVVAPDGRVPLPLHPSQAALRLSDGPLRDAVAAGRVTDLGPGSRDWAPTSSLRTVHRDGAPWMLKLSLGLRITNSRRENSRAELRLGRHVGAIATALEVLSGPDATVGVFDDSGWASADVDGREIGLAVALRQSPVRAGDPTLCLAGLTAERPGQGPSRLGAIIAAAGGADQDRRQQAAARWLDGLLDVLVLPLLRWHDEHGVGVEAHGQNALVTLDRDGFPIRGWYRDGQGWYITRSHAAAWTARVGALEPPGTELVFPDALVADRVTYYLGVNALLGIVGALGADGVADERALLHHVRRRLEPAARTHPDGVAARLAHAPRLTSKANLLTTVDGRDELHGPVAAQSVYGSIANPVPA